MSVALPSSLRLEQRGDVAVVTLDRPEKRNALDDRTVLALGELFASAPPWAKAAVLVAEGPHFSAGLDLAELVHRDAVAGMQHSRMWHRAFEQIESGTLPVVSVLKGAVVGGGLELAAATHVRVAERSAFYALPEAQRGLFVGGGGSVRLPRLIGTHRMADMMLTGRVLSAEEGDRYGVAQYLVDDDAGLKLAMQLANRIAANSSVTNYAVLQALPRISSASPQDGFALEALMAGVAQSSVEAKERMADFLEGRAAKVRPSNGTGPS